MKQKKKYVWAVLIALIVIQFVQPKHNDDGQLAESDISKMGLISDSAQFILKNSCYDCHSNSTRYPWYANIQPVGWFMSNHIKQGKKQLNFSEFGSYSPRRQLSKLSEIENELKDDNMPLASYKLMHKDARLSLHNKELLINLTRQISDSISAN